MVVDYAKLTDKELIAECQSDNMRAFNQLFDRYFESFYHFSVAYVKNSEIAEELAMDVMYNIWRKRAQLHIEGEVKNYLFKAMKNTLFNHIRKKEIQTVDLEELPETIAMGHEAVTAALSYKELEKIYQLKLEQLSPQRKKIFKLSREENMTYPQIAEQMDLSINTIKTQMLVSLKFLREQMKEHVDITLAILLFYFF